MSQELRIESWIRTVLLNKQESEEKDDNLIVRQYGPAGRRVNTHSLHLLLFIDERAESRAEIPSYSYTESDPSMRRDQFILSQCMQQKELNWLELHYEWQFFPYNLDFLMMLLSVYYQPMKLLSCISPQSLFKLLQSTGEGFSNIMKCLQKEVSCFEVCFVHALLFFALFF